MIKWFHLLTGYNAYREFCGLGRARTFDDLAKEMPNEVSRRALEKVYKYDLLHKIILNYI